MTLETGIHPGLSMAEYAQLDAANKSTLQLFKRSAMHAHHERLKPRQPTDALTMGEAVHCAVLEPDAFPHRVVCGLDHDRRSNANKKAWADFENEHMGKVILKEKDFTLCCTLRDEAWKHPRAKELLGGQGANELTVVWDHVVLDEVGEPRMVADDSGDLQEEVIRCKSRLDRITDDDGWTTCIDLKTSDGGAWTDASPGAFKRDVAKYSYHVQAAFYLDGLNVLDERDRKWVFIVVEKEAPHGIGIYNLPESAIEVGRLRYESWLRQYADCRRSGNWPGYQQSEVTVDIPEWEYRAAEEGF